jgi:hypothetical protein
MALSDKLGDEKEAGAVGCCPLLLRRRVRATVATDLKKHQGWAHFVHNLVENRSRSSSGVRRSPQQEQYS